MRQCLYDKDGTWHDIGSSWRTSDCMSCYCQANGDMGCCQTYFEPLGFPDDCMKEFDQKACKYNVFKKNDRSIPCHFRGRMRQCLYDNDGTWHDIGSRWRTSDCMRCYCQANGVMSCCQTYFEPTRFPDDCMMEFDQKACKYNVFKKNDRSIPCPIYGGMRQCLYDKDGTWHDIGSSWRTSDCMSCYCEANGDMSCCQTYFEPMGFPDDCMKEFDQKACKYNVFKKNDSSIPCPMPRQ
ncbi:unnamed protein product [Coregonus sp. 'balchen']|nr:unnamed protein product [Coregonus sp. 'balchen']